MQTPGPRLTFLLHHPPSPQPPLLGGPRAQILELHCSCNLRLCRAKQVLMGSDWPHAEGLPHPLDYADELRSDGFAEDEIRLVMRENALTLIGA